jgi:hypothetical protein
MRSQEDKDSEGEGKYVVFLVKGKEIVNSFLYS